MNKEFEALEFVKSTLKAGADRYFISYKDLIIIQKALTELKSIKEAEPSEAMNYLYSFITENETDIDHLDYTGYSVEKQQRYKEYLFQKRKMLNSISEALHKAQEQDELIEEYDLKPYELREALLLYAMYKGEYKGKPLPALKQYKEQEKVLEIIKNKCLTNCNLALVKDNLHYKNYCKEFEYFLNKYNESPNGFEITKDDLLTEEEFDTLKRYGK